MTEIIAVFTLLLGGWSVQFDEPTQQLTLTNAAQNISIEGTLAFQTVDGEQRKVVPPRDNVPNRLAIVDKNNDVQGYISFQVQGDKLDLLVYHRTRQFYEGTLTYDAKAKFRPDSFACRVTPSNSERVLNLAAGAGDSLLNDAAFAREEDLLLKFQAGNRKLTTAAEPGVYNVVLSGRIDKSAEATFSFEIVKDFLKNRYVPYYAPIDRKRCPSAPTGWMSWNLYFDQAGSKENLDEARVGQKYLQPFGLEFWSIESWQGNSPRLPVSNFYNLNLEVYEPQFPEGMKWLADEIRKLGFRPGLWTAPFGTGNTEFYEQHKDWFLHDKEGKPMSSWNGKYTIDPSNDEVIAHIKKIHDIASHEWGYEYFKIDGMSGSGGHYCAHFFDRPYVKEAFKNPKCPDPFERVVNALRAGIGPDRVFLACQGHSSGPEAAVADASRIGSDIVHPWQPVKWENILQQAGRTINQVFVHNIVFWADPDTLLVNPEALELEQARVTTTIVSLPGQMMFAGDKLGKLPMERMRLLQQTLPVCDVHPMNLYPYFCNPPLPVWDLKVVRSWGAYDVVALFNWETEEKEVGFDFAELGLDDSSEYALYEFWTEQYQGLAKGRFSMKVPPRSVRLLAVHKKADRPQFLSSDRHITQGAVDIVSMDWIPESNSICGQVKLVAGNKTTLRFLAPDGSIKKRELVSDKTEIKEFTVKF